MTFIAAAVPRLRYAKAYSHPIRSSRNQTCVLFGLSTALEEPAERTQPADDRGGGFAVVVAEREAPCLERAAGRAEVGLDGDEIALGTRGQAEDISGHYKVLPFLARSPRNR